MAPKVSELYLVTKHFKAGGIWYFAGSVLSYDEVLQIKLYKIRLNEGKVVQMNIPKPKLEAMIHRINGVYKVDVLANIRERVSKGSEIAEPEAKASTPNPGTKAVVKTAPAKVSKPKTE